MYCTQKSFLEITDIYDIIGRQSSNYQKLLSKYSVFDYLILTTLKKNNYQSLKHFI